MATTTLELAPKAQIQPVFVNFTNGKLQPDQTDQVRFGLYEGGRNKKLLVAETERMTYTGQNFGSAMVRGTTMTKYMLGVRDKTTGKMRLYDTSLFDMKPVIAGREDNLDELDTSEKKDTQFREKVDKLTSAFGSSKKRRAMESRIKNKIKGEDLERAVNTAVDEAFTQALAQRLASPSKLQAESDLIPPHNKDATRAQDVYSLNDIISGAEMDELYGAADVFVNSTPEERSKWREEERYPHYVLHHLGILPLQEEARRHKAQCLLYLHYLLLLYKMGARGLRVKDPWREPVPSGIKKKLFDKFTLVPQGTSNNRRCQPARLKDQLGLYILVLALIIDEFNLTTQDLQLDMKLNQRKMSETLRVLGCQVKVQKKDTGDNLKSEVLAVTLPVPLTFPKKSVRSKKERS